MTGGAKGLAAALAVACAAGCTGPAGVITLNAPTATHDTGAAANRRAAEREARRLLTLTDVPPGARVLHSAPARLDGPAMGTPAVESLVDAARFWSVPMSLGQAQSWFDNHPPRGKLTKEGGSSGGGGADFETAGYSYWAGQTRAWRSAELEVSLLTEAGRTYVRVDGVVVWLDPTPLRDDSSGPRIHFTVADGCPTNDRGPLGVSNDGADLDRRLLPDSTPLRALACLYGGFNRPAFALAQQRVLDRSTAGAVARRLGALPLSHVVGGQSSCPAGDGSAGYVAFEYADGRTVDLTGGLSGCASVSNGHIRTIGSLATVFGRTAG
jgi:hypothetical protein